MDLVSIRSKNLIIELEDLKESTGLTRKTVSSTVLKLWLFKCENWLFFNSKMSQILHICLSILSGSSIRSENLLVELENLRDSNILDRNVESCAVLQ